METSEIIEKMMIINKRSELLDDAMNMIRGFVIYVEHIRRYYPKVHDKTAVSKKLLKHDRETEFHYDKEEQWK